jgi:hypothetical protein
VLRLRPFKESDIKYMLEWEMDEFRFARSLKQTIWTFMAKNGEAMRCCTQRNNCVISKDSACHEIRVKR